MLKKISIIIPVYNESKTIREIIKRVLKSSTLGLKKEIIIVDDGSSDGTTEILRKIRNKAIKIIYFSRNKGKGTAIRKAASVSSGDIVLIQDADLEYNPKDYPKIITPFIKNNVQVVYGSRELTGRNIHSSLLFHLGGRLITAATNVLFNGSLTDVPTGYKAFKRKLLIQLPLRCRRFEFCPEVTAKILKRKISILEVPITYTCRHKGEGKKIGARDGVEALLTLTKIRFNL